MISSPSKYIPTIQEIRYQLDHPDQSRQTNVIAAVVLLLIIAYVAVALRCLARYKTKIRFGSDDVLIIIALVVGTGYAICLSVELRYGFARHIVFIRNLRSFVVISYVGVALFALSTALTKASILYFYCRVFRSRKLMRFSYLANIFIAAYNLTAFLVVLLECLPIKTTWTLTGGQCFNIKVPIVFLGCVNIVVDFVILAIPIRFVLRLHMDKARKLQVCGIFLAGILTCVFSVVRVVTFALANFHDVSYDLTYPSIFTLCEISIGILTACLPTIGLFFNRNHSLSIGSTVRSAWSQYFSSWPWHSRNKLNLRLPSTDEIDEKSNFSPITPTAPAPTLAMSSPIATAPILAMSSPIAGQVLTVPLMVAVEGDEPRCLLEVNIPCHKLHRHSACTDSITRLTTDEYRWQMAHHIRGNIV